LTLSVIINAVIADSIYLVSQERIGIAYAFPISGLVPIYTYFIAIIFLGENLLFGRLIGTVIAVAGVIILSREQNRINVNQETGKIDKLGIALAFLTSILYAIGTIILQIGVTDVEPVEGNFIRVFYGSIAFIPIFLFSKQHKKKPSCKALRNIIIAGFFGMGIGSLMYVTSVKLLGAAISSVVNSTSPLFAVVFSTIFLKERVSKAAGLSIIMIVLGVVLVVIGI
jgi:drug/metabolite transporter (DMT)-like permease